MQPSWLNYLRTYSLPLLAALVVVLMVPVGVAMLVRMLPRLVGVFLPVMAMGAPGVAMLVLMFVFAVTAHPASPPFALFI
jgi:hypothetical protein